MSSCKLSKSSTEITQSDSVKTRNKNTMRPTVVASCGQSSETLENGGSKSESKLPTSSLLIKNGSTVSNIENNYKLKSNCTVVDDDSYGHSLYRTPSGNSVLSSTSSLSPTLSEEDQVVVTLSEMKPSTSCLSQGSRKARVRGKRNMVNDIKLVSRNLLDTVQTRNSIISQTTDMSDNQPKNFNISDNSLIDKLLLSSDNNYGLKQDHLFCPSNEATDILFENQRGWSIIGQPYYSGNTLIQHFDPPPWTIGNDLRNHSDSTLEKWFTKKNKGFETAPGDIYDYPLPDPTWEWKWNTWYVDMSGDVDDNGWSYSFQFGSNRWHGTNTWFHSWVRRRTWKRIRWRKPFILKLQATKKGNNSNKMGTNADLDGPSTEEISPTIIIRKLINNLRICRLDRERINLIAEFVKNEDIFSLVSQHVKDPHELRNILETFDFRNSKIRLKNHLLEIIDNNGTSESKKGPCFEEVQRVDGKLLEPFEQTPYLLSPNHKGDIKNLADAIEAFIRDEAFYSEIIGDTDASN